jgi:hypothetical protein
MSKLTGFWRATLLATVVTAAAIGPSQAFPFFGHYHNDGSYTTDPLLCFTDYQVRQAVAEAGFRNIFLNASIEAHQRVRATRGNTVYLIDFNICAGRIVSVSPLRSAR